MRVKQRLEEGPHQRLDEEQLGKEGEGGVEAHQLEPVRQQGEEIKARMVKLLPFFGRARQAPVREISDGTQKCLKSRKRRGMIGKSIL